MGVAVCAWLRLGEAPGEGASDIQWIRLARAFSGLLSGGWLCSAGEPHCTPLVLMCWQLGAGDKSVYPSPCRILGFSRLAWIFEESIWNQRLWEKILRRRDLLGRALFWRRVQP